MTNYTNIKLNWLRKWRRFKLGKYTLVLYGHENIESGIGHKTGSNIDILGYAHAFYINGVQKWHKFVGFNINKKF